MNNILNNLRCNTHLRNWAIEYIKNIYFIEGLEKLAQNNLLRQKGQLQ